MKIERLEKEFNPVKITLESEFEVSVLWDILYSIDRGF